MTDPIADMLTRIRNALIVKHEAVEVPASNMKKEIARLLLQEGYITSYELVEEEVQSKLLEMFYTTKINGTGLGVSLSNEIIKAHNGKLLYKSELNKGTIATIRLPYV
mgnify:CR=1 FL=1